MITYLKSNRFAIIIAILSVAVQSFHSYTAVYNISSLKGTPAGVIQAALFALVFDAAILFFTVRNKRDVVLGASVFFVLMNVYYYYSHLGIQFDFIFGCLISLILPTMQYYYSEEIVEEPGEAGAYELELMTKQYDRLQVELKEAHADRGRLNDKIKHLQDNARNGDNVVEQLQRDNDRLADQITVLRDNEGRYKTDLEAAQQEIAELTKLNDNQAAGWEEATKSNSILSEMLGQKDGEIIELRKALTIEVQNQTGIPVAPELQPHNYIEPAAPKAYNPTRTDAPAV